VVASPGSEVGILSRSQGRCSALPVLGSLDRGGCCVNPFADYCFFSLVLESLVDFTWSRVEYCVSGSEVVLYRQLGVLLCSSCLTSKEFVRL